MQSASNVVAIIVTYNPEQQPLYLLASALARQCQKVVIVDNSEPPCEFTTLLARHNQAIQVVPLGANQGIASAQNIGIKQAFHYPCDAIALFDQDSVIDDKYIGNIYQALECARKSLPFPVAAIGPCYQDDRQTQKSPFVKVSGLCIKRVACNGAKVLVEVDCLIASGSLLTVEALKTAGCMQEDLFIDYVDAEWCLRAKSFGYRCVGACHVSMKHSLGDDPITVFGRKFTLHSPLRHYYLMRNAASLYLRSNLPIQWKIADGLRLMCKFIIYGIFGKPRLMHIKMMLRGLYDGLRGRMGRFV